MTKNKIIPSLEGTYNHQKIEDGLYDFWLQEKLFSSSELKDKPPFTIILPPPNVTGKLHIGHALNGTLQDILIRYKRLTGHQISWIPGMDHAGIATQSKVEAELRKKNIFKEDLGREKFIAEIWKWKDHYSNSIKSQWAKMGFALDYDKERFTLDKNSNEAVNKVFVDMYNAKIIYRGKSIINWDPVQKTALSNIEVNHKEIKGKLYTFKYCLLDDGEDFLLVSTTRPETMFADTALVVHPEDKRYLKYIGQQAINPATNKPLIIIADSYVDQEFGTGVMKVTPAHDINDFNLGKKHNLAMPICLDKDGKVNNLGEKYVGLDRFIAREKLVNDLTKDGKVDSVVDHIHQVGHSERSNAIVEPYLSSQWFVNMKAFSNSIIKHSKGPDRVEFYPERFSKELLRWMEKVNDWCISRQLWWGHQIPAWYDKKGNIKVQKEMPENGQWVQDKDVLDTWFSSALWPFSAIGWPQSTTNLDNHFPTNVLVTGYDIIFFWVSRMYFQALYFINNKPFEKVLIHGLVRDSQGRKMSKSLGNGIDPMAVIDKHGTDSLRFFLVTSSTPGQDFRYNEAKIISNNIFINKIWNIVKFVSMNNKDKRIKSIDEVRLSEIDKWILLKFDETIIKVNDCFEKFDFVILGKVLKNFIINDFANWYLELSKVNLLKMNQNDATLSVLTFCINNILILLHPIMPFVTEYLYLSLNSENGSILKTQWPSLTKLTKNLSLNYIDDLFNIIKKTREIRSEQNISKKNHFSLYLVNANHLHFYINEINDYLMKIINVIVIDKPFILLKNQKLVTKTYNDVSINFMLDKDLLQNTINTLKQDLMKIEKEILRSKKILNNPAFIERAAPEKVKIEQDKYDKYLKQQIILQNRLTNFNQ